MLDANNRTQEIEYAGWVMRERPAAQKPARLLLLLHGWTGDENSMWVFVRKLPGDYHILAPRAPHKAEQGGYSWRELQPGTWGLPTLFDLRPAADDLIRLVDGYASQLSVDATQFDLAGFSQGGALVNVLALLYPGRIGRAAVLAGFMPGDTNELLDSRVIAGKPFFIAHGTQDKLVSPERARHAVASLQEAGAQVTFCEAEVGHRVSAECLRGLETFFGPR